MSSDMQAQLTVSAIVGFIFVLVIIGIIYEIARIIADYFLFKKAGQEGWKAFVPYLCSYTQLSFTWNKEAAIAYLIISTISALTTFYWRQQGAAGVAVVSDIMLAVWAASGAAAMVMHWISLFKLAKSFGKGIGFALGLVFLQPIFIMVLAYDKDIEYVGPAQ